MPAIKFDPELCASCETVDCLMKCQYIEFTGISDAKAEKSKINAGEESRVLYECLTCYACQEYCQFGIIPSICSLNCRKKGGF